jgi:hypothetical protein
VRGLTDRLVRAGIRRGLRNGLLAGDGKWLALGAAAWLVRFLAKSKEPETIRERLRVGESITVTNLGPPLRRRQARRQRKAEQVAGETG